jgi:hypothetical protein
MGLTIHYKLATNLAKPYEVHHLLRAVREFALDLPFEEVGEIQEFKGKETNHDDGSEDDRWLKIQASGHVVDEPYHYTVPPRHVIAFSTWPGEGCEPANFGFSSFPKVFNVPDGNKRLMTHLDGWRWGSFCKTQYASDPNCGGVENFLRCHLCVVKLLDFIKQTGLVTVEVNDEGDYWEKRDLKALVQEVGNWNEVVAGMSSLLGEAMEKKGMTIQASIRDFPNFEHLEAKGLDTLAELRRRLEGEK